jgi:transposase
MEATGYSRWFERLLAELGFELWIGDPAQIKAKRVKKQKTDRNVRSTTLCQISMVVSHSLESRTAFTFFMSTQGRPPRTGNMRQLIC